MKVLLTGTSGNLGSRVLQSILHYHLIPAEDLIISTSSPHKVQAIAKQNDVQLIPGDFTNPEELRKSYAASNADILFLVSYPTPSSDRWLHHKTAIDAANQSGCIKLIVYTSLMFGGESGLQSVAGVQQAHIETINYPSHSGCEYVILREGIYAESWWLYAGFQPHPVSKDNVDDVLFVIPKDGPIAWVSWDDLGEGTAKILSKLAQGHREYIGKTLNLTGPRVTTISEIARILERISKRTVEVKLVGKEDAKAYHLKDGSREQWLVDSWVGWYDAIEAGECAVVDPFLEQIIGRQPKGVEDCAVEMFTPR